MRLAPSLGIVALALATMAQAEAQKTWIVTFKKSTPQSVQEGWLDELVAAGGTVRSPARACAM